MENSLKRVAYKFGLGLAAIITSITIVAYLVNLDLFVTSWFGLIIYGISIVLGIASILKVKQNLVNFISFREAFAAYFICILIGLSIYTIATYILFNFIDFDASEYLKEKSMEKMIEIMKQTGTPDSKISEAVEVFQSQNLYAFGNAFQSLLISYLLPLSVIGLLIAAVTKKSNPETE